VSGGNEALCLARTVKISSVATGGGGTPPTVDRHGHRTRAHPRRFLGGGSSDSSPPDLLADGEGARCAAPLQKPHPRIGPSSHVTGVTPNFEILATPLVKINI